MDPKAGAGPSTRHREEATATIDLYRQLYIGSDKIPKLKCKPETDEERKHRLQTRRENAANRIRNESDEETQRRLEVYRPRDLLFPVFLSLQVDKAM